ncbi:hypothetical protein N7467_004314 [Penicillium canescens]|nr:hypothetical protein N7467_004314 [Penicillium canescens]
MYLRKYSADHQSDSQTTYEVFTRNNKEHLGKPPTATNRHQRMNISARHGENPAFCPRVSRVRGRDVL